MTTPDIHAFDFGTLSAAERLLLAQDLWDSVISDIHSFPMTGEERQWLDQRIAEANDPATVWYSWHEVAEFVTSAA